MPMQSYHFPLIALFVLVLALPGCDLLGQDGDTRPKASHVVVANGGNFSDQNGHLTTFDPATSAANKLGSMAGFVLDIIPDGENRMVLVNTFGPGRIEVLDAETFSPVSQWTGFDSPRAAVRVGEQVWVSTYTWGAPGQVVVLSEDGSIQRLIQVGDIPEGLAIWQQSVVVANNGSLGAGTTISRIPQAAGGATTLETGCDGPRDLFPTASSLILVCTGKTVYSADYSQILESTPGQVVFFSPEWSISSRITLPGQAGSTNGTRTAHYSESTDELFITIPDKETVVVVDVPARRLTQTVDLSGQAGLLGLSGVAYDAGRDQLYVGRFPESSEGAFPDFAAAGTVQIFTRRGDLLTSFRAGASISSIFIQ